VSNERQRREFKPTFTRELRYTVRAGRIGDDGYRGCLVLPTRHGEIILCATIPDGALKAFRQGLRMLSQSPEVGALGPSVVRELATECGAPCIGGVVDTIQSGLSALGPWGAAASAGLGAINSLFGGGTYGGPVIRPENLPAEGSTTNIIRIARHVGITNGMAVDDAKRRLENGLRQNWAGADHNDARKLIGALNALGSMPPTIEQLANVATRVDANGRLNLPPPPQAPQRPQYAPQPARPQYAPQRPQYAPQRPPPAPPSPALAQAMGALYQGQMQPADLAPYLGAASALAQGAELASSPAGAEFFGAEADPMAQWLQGAMQANDAVAGVELFDAPRARAILARGESSLDPRVTEAVRAAKSFHQYLHEGM
jgi:hypothetical protein